MKKRSILFFFFPVWTFSWGLKESEREGKLYLVNWEIKIEKKKYAKRSIFQTEGRD